ncbi:ASCH domain protein [uncultured archaeon]|nr:ASCH domain protein [uncultured archaeon]
MKVLSLKQPFAELVVQGKKTIELRKWNTKFRGEFLIHASKVPDKKSMERFGFKDLPLGAIVGKAKLVEVKEYKSEEEHRKDRDKHLASDFWGNYGFVLENAQRIKPIPARGNLNFWEFKYDTDRES